MESKQKIKKIIRSFYIPVHILEEIENITAKTKGLNVNKIANEGLELWLTRFNKEAKRGTK